MESRWFEKPFSDSFPLAHLMRSAYPEYWFRIHALPKSKRGPESDNEREIVFDRFSRFGTALLGHNSPCLIVQSRLNRFPRSKDLLPSLNWKSIHRVKESDEDYFDSWAAHTTWNPDELRDVLLAIAEDREELIAFVSLATDCVLVPYDGGADGFSFDKERLRKLAEEFSAWASINASGL